MDEVRHFDRTWAVLALFGMAVSSGIAIAYYPLRLGLPTPAALVPGCVLVVAAALLGPLLLPARGVLSEIRHRAVIMPLVSLAVLASVLLAFWLGRFWLIFFLVLTVAGLWRALTLLRAPHADSYRGLAVLSAAFAAYLFAVVHNLGYAGVFSQEQALLGTLNHDTIIHSAIAYLIQNFGIPSIGLDGVLPVRYHFGSHIWLAALGSLTGAEPTFSYSAAVPIVSAPLLVIALVLSAAAIDGGRKSAASYLIWGLGLVILADAIDHKSYYISESYTFGLIGLLLMLPLLAALARIERPTPLTAVGFGIALLAIPMLALLKISVGVLWTAALGWVALRRFGLSKQAVVIGVVALGLLAAILWGIAPNTNDYRRISTAMIVPFYYFNNNRSLSGFASLLLPVCLLLLRTKSHGAGNLRAIFVNRCDLMLEVTAVVAFAGFLPPLLGIPQDPSVWYFFNVAQWIATSLLVTRLAPEDFSQFAATVRAMPLFRPAVAVASFVFVSFLCQALYPPFYLSARDLVVLADEKADGKLLNGGSVPGYFIDALRREHVLWSSAFRTAMASSAGSGVVQAVRGVAGSPQPDLAVFIPPENTAFWTLHSICRDKHNVQVALTGQPSLLGGPPRSYNCPIDAYTMSYGTEYESRDISDADLCAHAIQRRIGRIFILNESRPSEKNRLLQCQGAR